MKPILICVSVALLGLSSWLWYQLREANGSCNSVVVSHYTSQLLTARHLEERTEVAPAHRSHAGETDD